MATYSNNTTIKVGDNFSYRRGPITSVYSESWTVPAGSVLETERVFISTAGPNVSANVKVTYPGHSQETMLSIGGSSSASVTKYRFPAGSIIQFNVPTANFGDSATFSIVGFLYTNTP